MISSHASSNKWHSNTDGLTLLHCQYYNVFIIKVLRYKVRVYKNVIKAV